VIVRRGEPKERPLPVKRVAAIGVAGLIIGALLNANAILETAKQKPFGTERDIWVAVWEPIAWVSNLFFLDEPRNMLDDALGRSGGGGDDFVFPPPTGETPAPGATQQPGQPTPTPEQPSTPTATPTPVPPRQPTAEEPLRLWVGGDSQAQVFGESVVAMSADTGLIDSHLDYRISTGLTRPDYFNWPAHLASEIEERQPEVLIVVFGANDAQGIQTPEGDIYQPFEDGWVAEYRRRVAGTMDLLEAPGRRVFWVAQPIAQSWEYSQRMAELNTIYEEEAASRPWITYFDTWPLFTDENGNYSAFLPDESGAVQNMRQGDGIHLSRPGGDRLARALLEAIGEEVNIGPGFSNP
jgi:uncharacterized protein